MSYQKTVFKKKIKFSCWCVTRKHSYCLMVGGSIKYHATFKTFMKQTMNKKPSFENLFRLAN